MTAQARHRETRRATYQDVLDAPPRMVAEVISGTLHTHPGPAMRHVGEFRIRNEDRFTIQLW